MGVKASEKSLAKSCPPKLRALLKGVDFSYQKAADMAGLSKSYVANVARGTGTQKFGELAHGKVAAALERLKSGDTTSVASPSRHGAPAVIQGDNTLGIAICFADNKKLTALFKVGEVMGGAWVYRKRFAGGKWQAILKMEDQAKRQSFAEVASVFGEVVLP